MYVLQTEVKGEWQIKHWIRANVALYLHDEWAEKLSVLTSGLKGVMWQFCVLKLIYWGILSDATFIIFLWEEKAMLTFASKEQCHLW